MQKYKMARWRHILRRGAPQRRLIKSIGRLRHSQSRLARVCSLVVLSVAWLVLPLLAGCARRTEKPKPSLVAPSPQPAASTPPPALPTNPTPAPTSRRNITIRGLDNDYRGKTSVLPNKQLIHRKESP